MSTRKFAFIASLLSVVGLLAGSARAADTCKVIAVNFNTSTYTIADDEDAGIIGLPTGAVVYGEGVNKTDGKASSEPVKLTVYDAINHAGAESVASITWSASGVYKYAATSKLLQGYLDDNASTPTTIDFADIPFVRYDVYVYMQSDTQNPYTDKNKNKYTVQFAPVKLNNTLYICNDANPGVAQATTSTADAWGTTQALTPALGTSSAGNVICIKEQVGNSLNLSLLRYNHTSKPYYYHRASIAAIVIVDTSPSEITWTGKGDGSTWTDDANWDFGAPAQGGSIVLDGTGTDTVYNLGTLSFSLLNVASGDWTAEISGDCFKNTPLTIAAGASFTLKNAEGKKNPFATTGNDIQGTLDLGGATQEADWTDVLKDGSVIKNGVFELAFSGWMTAHGLSFTIGPDAIVNTPMTDGNQSYGELNLRGGTVATIDGGTFNNNNSRETDGNNIGNDGTDGTLRIINGGTFTGKRTNLQIGNRQGSTGVLSVDHGTVDIGDAFVIHVAPNKDTGYPNTTGVLAVTNGTITAAGIKFCHSNTGVGNVSLVDSILNLNAGNIYKNKDPADGSFCIMDGCTINSGNAQMLSNLNSIPYQLEGKGLIANPTVDSDMKGYYVARATDRGTGPIVKIGDKTLNISGVLDGTKGADGTAGVTDYQVLGGVMNISGGTYLPVEQLNLTAKTGGRFEGGIGSDLTDAYNSLTVDGTVTIPLVFDENGCSQIKAKTLVLDTTEENPVTLDCSGSFTEGVEYCIRENFSEDDVAKLAVTGLDAKLVYRDGKLYVEPKERANGTITWQGGEGAAWWGLGNWNLNDKSTKFLNGDAVVFNTENAAVVLDEDAAVTGLYVTNDVAITGEKTLTTPIVDVAAEKTTAIAVPLSEDIEKTGEGELVLRDYADGKALDLTEGKVSLVWSEGPKSNPFSMEMDANSIAGVLDLGGATQTVWVSQSASPDQTFLDGFKLLNGTLTADCEYWFHVNGERTLTVGQGATLNLNQRSGADARGGELNIRQGSAIVVDGGTFNANNARSGSAQGNVVGNDWSDGVESNTSKLLVINGGEFNSPNNYLEVGVKQGVTGILAVTNGTVNLANGTKWLSVAPGRGDPAPTGVVSMQGGTLIAETIVLCDASAGNTAQLTFEDSNISAQRIYAQKTPSQDSFVIFDGVTWTVTGTREDILADPGCPITIGDGGLTIYTDHDVTISTPLAGEGGLVKKGSGKLTFSGAQSFEGGLEVCAGSIGVKLTADGFATQDLDLSLNLADGETVQLTIDGTPEPGVNYTLFKSGITEETLPRLTIDANYELSLEDGQLKVKLTPLSLTWTGEGENKLWSTVANWRDATREPAKFDTVIFDGESDETEYDLADGLLLKEIDVNSGAWTTKVNTACFAGVPVHVETGALFALTGAKVTNPFSTANDANAIAGVLDFGGAKQTLAGNVQNNSGIFRNGGEVRHGEIEVDPSSWLNLNGITDFTVGEGANVYFKRYATNTDGTRNRGQLNMYNAYLRISGEGARFAVMNERTTQDGSKYNSYGKIGSSGGDATVEVGNGGTFAHEKRCLILGWDPGITGAIVGDGGNVTVKGQEIFLGYKGAAVLALTNSTLTADSIKFGWSGQTPGKQTVELINSTATIGQIGMNQALADGSSVVFDGATIVDNHEYTALLQVLGIPYTIAEGGLTVKVANLDPTKEEDYISFPGTFEGEGDFILVAAGKTPREARFSGEAEKGFTGNLVVSNGVTAVAGDKTFKGGLYACEGSTLNVATSVFDGNVTIEEGVKFTGLDAEQDYEKPVTLLQTKGTITSPLLEGKNPNTRNRYFVRSRLGVNVLCYGRKRGTIITIR